jgi:hypothetical protein
LKETAGTPSGVIHGEHGWFFPPEVAALVEVAKFDLDAPRKRSLLWRVYAPSGLSMPRGLSSCLRMAIALGLEHCRSSFMLVVCVLGRALALRDQPDPK